MSALEVEWDREWCASNKARQHFVAYEALDGSLRCMCGAQSINHEPRAVARVSDPRTSHDAAATVSGLRDKQRAVLSVLRRFPAGLTDEELHVHYDNTASAPMQSPSGLRTRRSELHKLGLIIDSGERRKLQSGRQGIVWQVTAEAVTAMGDTR